MLYYIGIADGMSSTRAETCRYSFFFLTASTGAFRRCAARAQQIAVRISALHFFLAGEPAMGKGMVKDLSGLWRDTRTLDVVSHAARTDGQAGRPDVRSLARLHARASLADGRASRRAGGHAGGRAARHGCLLTRSLQDKSQTVGVL